MIKVAIVGASGFLGQAVVRRLAEAGSCEVRAIVHSTGNAWALASAGVPLTFADLTRTESIRLALDGCTHVVNCSRGGKELMTKGLDNLLEESRRAGVQRLVHVSSVAVYGSQFPTPQINEDASPQPDTGYGELKKRQDEKVIKAHRDGMETVIFCPPNIGGAASSFFDDVHTTLKQGRFAFVGDSTQPIELVDVNNLAHAIYLGLTCSKLERRRYFITDDNSAGWDDLVALMQNAFDMRFQTGVVPKDVIKGRTGAPSVKRPGVSPALKHLVSSHVRESLRLDPFWAKVDRWIRALVAALPWALEDRLRIGIEGTVEVQTVDYWSHINKALCEQQLRGIRYSCTNAKAELGYKPRYQLEQSVNAYAHWRLGNASLTGNYNDMLIEIDRY